MISVPVRERNKKALKGLVGGPAFARENRVKDRTGGPEL